jgi:hypothetical protein
MLPRLIFKNIQLDYNRNIGIEYLIGAIRLLLIRVILSYSYVKYIRHIIV